MKTPFYQILELYEDAVLAHAHHDLTCTETAVMALAEILEECASREDGGATPEDVGRAEIVHCVMNEDIAAYKRDKLEAQREDYYDGISEERKLREWDHNRRMADLRADYKQQEGGR